MKYPIPNRRVLIFCLALGPAIAAVTWVAQSGQVPAAGPEFSETAGHGSDAGRGEAQHRHLHSERSRGPWPFLIFRTPYGAPADSGPARPGTYRALVNDGYIFVYQDIRGRYKSEGSFVMMRPPRDKRDPRADRREHGRLRHGRLAPRRMSPATTAAPACMGISYGGWLSAMAMLDPHPAVKAVSPQASPADMYLGDDFHHNGAFRLSYGFEYAAQDGDDQGEHLVRLRPLRHLRMVSAARPAVERQRKIPPREDPDLERLSSPTRTTTPSGKSRRWRPTSTG